MTSTDRSTGAGGRGGRLLSERIWSHDLLLGRPGGRFQVGPGRRPRERSIWRWRAWCAGVSSPSLATWPNRLLRLLIIRSMSGGIPVRSAISVLRTRSYHRIPRICLSHFTWKDSRLSVSESSRVHVSDAYNRTYKTSVLTIMYFSFVSFTWTSISAAVQPGLSSSNVSSVIAMTAILCLQFIWTNKIIHSSIHKYVISWTVKAFISLRRKDMTEEAKPIAVLCQIGNIHDFVELRQRLRKRF